MPGAEESPSIVVVSVCGIEVAVFWGSVEGVGVGGRFAVAPPVAGRLPSVGVVSGGWG